MMWVLLAVSLFGFIIFIERTLFLHRGQLRTGQFLEGIRNLVSRGRRLEALTLCEDMPGPIPGIVKAILLQAGASESKMRTVAEEAALVEIPILERRIGSIAAIARIAPLIGLLGTVLGMLQAFFGVPFSETVGYPTFGLLLGGIGQALLTTAFGLMIAIMAHIAHHFLHGRVRALVHDMEYTGHDLIQFMQQEQTDGGLPDEETQEPEADQ
ncbi:MotA/TolQ/ExbB proton channel family protein [Oceanipulchritudo coccoides]|nr:MotA/TolQ/ExbB proton channel family protein [Oceanipulchritudo coccoides]